MPGEILAMAFESDKARDKQDQLLRDICTALGCEPAKAAERVRELNSLVADAWLQWGYISTCHGAKRRSSGGLSTLEDIEAYLLQSGLIDDDGWFESEREAALRGVEEVSESANTNDK